MACSHVIVVFAKYPEPGRVKTRLIGRLGAEAAAEVHRACLAATLACATSIDGAEVFVAVSPDDAPIATLVGEGVAILPQGGGDLGERMERVIRRRFEVGCERLVVVGSDCPGMQPGDIARAFELLEGHDVVIGPALDGGYYLLGLCRPAPALFASVAWSSPQVAEQTRVRARSDGLSVAELIERRDIDEYADLAAARNEIAAGDSRLAGFGRFVDGLLKDGDERE